MSAIRLNTQVLALISLAACNYSNSGSSGMSGTSASSSTSAIFGEVTLQGDAGVAYLAADKVELKRGAAYVNGVSFGPVAPGAVVKYTKDASGNFLLVDGELRSAQNAER
ncbi:hypothetical protein [Piscinibacter sp. HJYY11]|uniref:hypothetical protein n=1 Tax=Piscinibacter sp. HJYY11 TaxID=2801333 RepID=UPI00191FBD4B|nr:hypothetical protein [Piscinibacter sp. HJYY11]MBL0729607.1 hypothetical protein [Piscinibacter sp. HJYY11]